MLKVGSFTAQNYILIGSVPSKILVCQHVPKKSAVLACLTLAKLKMNQRVSNKNADLLKKISLMGTELIGNLELTKIINKIETHFKEKHI